MPTTLSHSSFGETFLSGSSGSGDLMAAVVLLLAVAVVEWQQRRWRW